MNFTDFSLLLNNYPIFKAKRTLKKIQRIEIENFDTYIRSRKEKIVTFHLKNNLFYKSILENKIPENWNSLPILTKSDLQQPLKERLSKGFTLKSVYVNKTSGSSGHPFYFAKDKFTHALTWAIIQHRFGSHGIYGEKQARYYGLPKERVPRSKELLKDFFLNRYRFDVFDLSDLALEGWLQKYKQTKFVYVNGYTTVILAFAKFLISKNIVLKDVCSTLKACVVTSEMCFEKDKIRIEKAFGIPVINEYGASELDLIAFQNKENRWMINTESLFVEILDENNNPLPDGEVGKIVITSLYNKAHPFIRYEVGDVGSIERINQKNVVLEKLEGRREDLVYLPEGKVAPGLTFYYVTKTVMEDSNQVKEIKIIQTNMDTFEIHYVAIKEFRDDQKLKIKEALKSYFKSDLNLLFIKCTHLKRNKSGKLKQFTSLIKN